MSAKDKVTVEEALNVWAERYAPRHLDLKNIDNITRIGQAAQQLSQMNRLTVSSLVEAVAALDLNGHLVRKSTGPAVIEVVKEVPVQRKLSKVDRLQQAGLGATADKHIRTEFDRAEIAKPRASETELVAVAKNDLEVDAILNGVVGMINGYRAGSHSLTFKRQEELRGIFAKFKDQVKNPRDAEKMRNTIKEKIDFWDDSSIR